MNDSLAENNVRRLVKLSELEHKKKLLAKKFLALTKKSLRNELNLEEWIKFFRDLQKVDEHFKKQDKVVRDTFFDDVFGRDKKILQRAVVLTYSMLLFKKKELSPFLEYIGHMTNSLGANLNLGESDDVRVFEEMMAFVMDMERLLL